MIGGEWPDSHLQGVTFARHDVTVTDGRIGLHSGLFDGDIQSGINGLQLVHLATVGLSIPEATPLLTHLPPNPSRASQALVVTTTGRATVSILDASGRLLLRERSLGPETPIRWDGTIGSGLRAAPGVYFLAIDGGTGREHHRIVRLD
jgi:hypothetical protein